MNKFRNKDLTKNKETKKYTVETKKVSNYLVQTSSFKKLQNEDAYFYRK